MLQNLRERSGGIFAKIIFILIIASFALVGVGDMFYRYTKKPVAKVGGTTIQAEEFDFRLRNVRDQLMANSRGKIKASDLKAMGIHQQVLDDIINKTLVKYEMDDLGIMVDDLSLERIVKSIPAFQDKKGNFDRVKFDQMLRDRGSKLEILNNIREDLKKQQLFGTLSSSIQLPAAYKSDLYNVMNMPVTFSVIYVPEAHIQNVGNPMDADLEQIYKANPEQFTQPEYRETSILIMDSKKIHDQVTVTEQQIHDAYDRRKDEFMVPERRDVLQLSFTSREDAEKAREEISVGRSIDSVIKEYGPKVSPHSHAIKDKFPSSQGALIFDLNEPGVTDVVDSALEKSYYVFVVQAIEPAHELPLTEVKDRLVADVKAQLGNDSIEIIRNRVEDELAGGKNLDDLAKELNLQVIHFGNINKQGLNQKGASAFSDTTKVYSHLILENAFDLGEGTDSPVIDLPDGRMLVVHVGSIVPKTLPPFVDIRAEVSKYWKETKRQEAAANLSLEVVQKINSGESMDSVAKKHGLRVRSLMPVSRIGLQDNSFKDEVVTKTILQKGFKQPLHHATYGPTLDGFVVVVPTKYHPEGTSGDKKSEKNGEFERTLQGSILQDLEVMYLADLKKRYPVEINETVFQESVNPAGEGL